MSGDHWILAKQQRIRANGNALRLMLLPLYWQRLKDTAIMKALGAELGVACYKVICAIVTRSVTKGTKVCVRPVYGEIIVNISINGYGW